MSISCGLTEVSEGIRISATAEPDFPDPEAEASALSDILNADVVLSEESGHYPQADNPDTVAIYDQDRPCIRWIRSTGARWFT